MGPASHPEKERKLRTFKDFAKNALPTMWFCRACLQNLVTHILPWTVANVPGSFDELRADLEGCHSEGALVALVALMRIAKQAGSFSPTAEVGSAAEYWAPIRKTFGAAKIKCFAVNGSPCTACILPDWHLHDLD